MKDEEDAAASIDWEGTEEEVEGKMAAMRQHHRLPARDFDPSLHEK